MSEVIEFKGGGIKCDYCEYRNDTVQVDDYDNWLNKPCPDCGKNLLTKDDLERTNRLIGMAKWYNGLSEEDQKKLGFDEEGQKIEVEFDVHKEITIKSINLHKENKTDEQ